MQGFKDFILPGNVVDLAVAFIIGAAFATVVTSFVGDILTPLLGLIGLPDFSTASFIVGSAEVRRGPFLNAVISFVLVAAAVYLFLVKPMERVRSTEDPATKACTECASEIPMAAKRCPMCTSQQAA